MMHNPPHPGEFIREICIKPLGLTITQAAKDLGVSRKALSELVNGKAGISPEMALRLSMAFKTTPESWLNHYGHHMPQHNVSQRWLSKPVEIFLLASYRSVNKQSWP